MSKDIIGLEEVVMNMFEKHCKTGIFTLEFHLWDHWRECAEVFASLIISSVTLSK